MTVTGAEHGIRKRKRVSLEGVSHAASMIRSTRQKSSVDKTQFTINTKSSTLSRRQPVDPRSTYDWTVQTQGAHYARHRASFTQYSQLNFQLSNGQWCQGIGTVHLQLQSPDGPSDVLLDNVLHIPRAACNATAVAAFDTSRVSFSPVDGCRDRNGNVVWLTEYFHGFHRLVLPGNSSRDTSLEDALRAGVRPVGDTLSLSLSDRDIARIQQTVTHRPV